MPRKTGTSPPVSPPSTQVATAGFVGKIAAATALLVALGAFFDAVVAVVTKGKPLTCDLVASLPWCPSVAPSPTMSLICKYTSGPKNGQIHSFSGVAGAIPAPLDASCTDGQGSWGAAVADTTPDAVPTKMSLSCRYT